MLCILLSTHHLIASTSVYLVLLDAEFSSTPTFLTLFCMDQCTELFMWAGGGKWSWAFGSGQLRFVIQESLLAAPGAVPTRNVWHKEASSYIEALTDLSCAH